MATGKIIARVYTSEAEIPIVGAETSIYLFGENGAKNLISVRTTDKNGQTAPTEIETYPKSDSQSPEEILPFTECCVKVTDDRYETVIINNVQIFADVTTIQNVEMIPLAENAVSGDSSREFNVTPQDL